MPSEERAVPEDTAGPTQGHDPIEGGDPRPAEGPRLIVGVGGSAGALPALTRLLDAMGDNVSFAVVVVLHMPPDHQSHAVEILQRATALPVKQIVRRTPLLPGHVHVIAPGTQLITDDGHVQPTLDPETRPSAVIDLFFRTLGQLHKQKAVGVILSGTGRDGSLGLSTIKEHGGLTFAQAPGDCEHDDMPKAAIALGNVDLVLSAEDIGQRLAQISRLPEPVPSDRITIRPPSDDRAVSDDDTTDRALLDILTTLRLATRHDFRHYKRGTIVRRLQRRMQVNKLETLQAYRDYVRRHTEELEPLLADLLISVTNFFRDPEAFEALEAVVPSLLEAASDEEVRVWIPACASGEEAYSLAILLHEASDRMRHPPRVRMFASDISDSALNVARAGLYPGNISVDINDSRLRGFFEKDEAGYYHVRASIREQIVFARHNVLADPPFSRMDLISCRNLLIYLDRTAQSAALEMFAYALKPGGYLFLGNAESIDAAGTSFETVSKKHRIYRLRNDATATARVRLPSQLGDIISASDQGRPPPVTRNHAMAGQHVPLTALHERALLDAAPPSVLLDAQYDIERISSGAGRFLAFGEGEPTRSLLGNVAADIRVELRAALYRAKESNSTVRAVFRRTDDDGQDAGRSLSLAVHPVHTGMSEPLHWLVVFDEPTPGALPATAGEAAPDTYQVAMRRLEEENRALKISLQETLDRSAVSNEELKASNEELQAINEELRSAKEELETSKEELQSVNEELTTVNFELRLKVEEAGRNNDDLQNLIEASEIATVFVDPAMRVKRFTPQASKLFALIPSDVGRPLLDVKSQLRYEEIVNDATAVFNQLRPVERYMTSVDDEHFFARILPYRTSQDKIGGAVLTFVNVTELHRAENRAKAAEERLRDAIASSKDFAVISTDSDGRITTWNEGASRMFGYSQSQAVGQSIDILYTADDLAIGVPEAERRTAAREGRASDERWHVRSDGGTFFCSGITTPLHGAGLVGYVKIARDISAMKQTELQQIAEIGAQRQANAEQRTASELKDRFLAVMSHELKQPLNLIQISAELFMRLPETRESPQIQRIGQSIKRAIAAQEKIVDDLLDLSRMRTGKLRLHKEPVDLADVVQRLKDTVSADVASKNLRLDIDVQPKTMCDCDLVRIEQVVWNLLGNAVKFTPPDGRIGVKVTSEGQWVRLEVSDSGIGIPAEWLGTVFDLFTQVDSGESPVQRRAGLGIGLALVRELVEAHGGHVEARSNGRDQGATFVVWLPLLQDAAGGEQGDTDTPPSTAAAS